MLVQLCVVLRMVINEGQLLSLDRYEIVPCDDTKDYVQDNTLKELSEQSIRQRFLDNSQLNYLWLKNPMTQMMLPRPDDAVWSRPALFRKPSLSLTKLSKSLQNDYPSFRKTDFEFERRNKPITLVAFRNPKNGPAQQKALFKSAGELKSGEVAEMQSPYNDVSSFWQDERNA